jgi:hypothetical protein
LNGLPDSFSTDEDCVALGIICGQAYLGREPIPVIVTDGHAFLQTMVHYEVDATFFGVGFASCGKPDNARRRMLLAFDADLSVLPTWMMQVTNQQARITPLDFCKVTDANLNKTDDVVKAFGRTVDRQKDHIRDVVGASTLIKDAADEIWRVLARPIPIGSDAFLDLRPSAVNVGDITASNETINTTVSVETHPTLSLGPAPPNPDPLPPAPPFGTDVSDDRFHVMGVIRLPFEALNDQLSRVLVGQELKIRLPWREYSVSVTKTTLIASSDKVSIGIDLSGAVTGTVWINAVAKYEPADRILSISVTDVDIATKNLLLRVAQWLAPDFLAETVRSLVGNLSFDVGQRANEYTERARQALNRPLSSRVSAHTDIEPMEIRGPFTDQDAFLFTVMLTGKSTLTYRGDIPLPTGREIRYVSVMFHTTSDDKDAEEPVTLSLLRNGVEVQRRQVGVTERWGNGENQGPYFLSVPLDRSVSDCHQLAVRIRKEPQGSATGHEWHTTTDLRLYLSNGSDVAAAHVSDSLPWGDGDDHPFDRIIAACSGFEPF